MLKKTLKSTYFSYINLLRKLPISSEVLGPPKDFYKETKDYWILNLQEKNKESQGSFISIYPKNSIRRKLPKTIKGEVHWKFEIESTHEYPETFVTVIPKGRVWGHNGTVITPDDKLLGDLSFEIGTNISEHSILKSWRLPNLNYVDGTVAVLSAAGGEGYFHWMFDVLPRIHLLNQAEIQFNHIDKFLVNSLHLCFQKETLEILGIPEKKIIESRQFPHIKAKQLVVPSLPGQTGNIPKWACDFLKTKILVNSSTEKVAKGNLIYISRDRAAFRRIINEDELVQFLNKFKFEVIFLEKISVAEQASVLSSASVIVAAHGAGLSNLVFCSPGTKIIELFSPNYVNGCYWVLSNNMELDYYYLIGEGEEPEKFCDPHCMAEDILINIDLLAEVLKIAEVI
ncbi:glycosyltransferase family 61 protein [Nostoc sp. NZL]|uniref:glycosyltransferase family 61 protein n=1 Tax=Nostoc sp. NZL TaxID=2650612 RepID=UPI0018C6FB7B|nr:glycosyltransferase family 61 protein [Nostoc sp. NZL]MBG1245356.1 glycosyltransferase family 61 protein [Nostoc sp. NZL]